MRRFAQLRPGFLTDVAPAAPAAPLIGSSAASTSFMFPPALGRRLAASRSDRLLYAVAALMQRRTRTTAASAESTNDLQPTIYIPSSPPPAPPLPPPLLLPPPPPPLVRSVSHFSVLYLFIHLADTGVSSTWRRVRTAFCLLLASEQTGLA